MLSRGAGSLIPDIENLPVSPVSENQLVTADISFLSASNFGRLLVAEHDNITNDVVLISPTNHCQESTDHNSIIQPKNDHVLHQTSSATPPVPKLNQNSTLGSSYNHSSTESEQFAEQPLSDNHFVKSLPHGIIPLEYELISPSKRLDRESHNAVPSTSKQSFMLPTGNVKHNVTEKVAQVGLRYVLKHTIVHFHGRICSSIV